MPLLLVLRDHAGETVLVRPESAVLFIWSALLDADLGDEGYVLEPHSRDGTGSARFRTLVVRIEAKRAVEDGFKDEAVGIRHPLLPIGGARQEHEVVPKLAPLAGSVDDGELEVEPFAVALSAALVHAILANAASADVHRNGRDCALRDQIGSAWRRGIGVVIRHHGPSPMFERVARVKRC